MSDVTGNVKVVGHPPLGASDHIIIVADIPLDLFREAPTKRTVWRYARADWDRLRNHFRTLDWDTAFTDSPDDSCKNITDLIIGGMKRFIPSRTLVSRPSDPAWWTPECTSAVNHKKKAWKHAADDKSPLSRKSAEAAAQQCTQQLRRAEAAHYQSLSRKLSQGGMTDKEWWSTIKKAGGQGRNTAFPTLVGSDGTEFVSNIEKAECLARYFSAKCSLSNDFSGDSSFPETEQKTTETLSRIHIRQDAVRRELQRLDPAKATGPDGIPARVLKACAVELSVPLARLYSFCLRERTQPAIWKIARIVPVHKKKSKSSPANYRPISLLCIISKVMEGLVNRQVTNFLERHNILSSSQYGFRAGMGTADLLARFHHEWMSTASSGGAVHALAIDIAGAFDRVSHKGVLFKASACGLGGELLGWMTDYLAERRLCVAVGGRESSIHPVTAGVPQGSLLGPTLFLLYVNDCEDCIQSETGLGVYADDTTLHQCTGPNDDTEETSAQLQTAVDSVAAWGASWKISFEPSKSQALSISYRRPPHALDPIQFSGTEVKEEAEIKLLGVTFDNKLTYSAAMDEQRCIKPLFVQ